MAGDQPVGGVGVVMLGEAFREHVLLVLLQHGKFADFGEIARKTAFRSQ